MKAISAILVISISVCANAQMAAFTQDLDAIRSKSVSLKSAATLLKALEDSETSKTMRLLTPSLSASVGRQRQDVTLDKGLATELRTQSENDYWKASAQWNLFRGGGDWQTRKASEDTRAAQVLRVQDETLKQEARAAGLIFHELYLADVLRATKELVALRDQSHQVVQQKYKQGKLPLQEVMKSEVDRAQQQARLRTLEIERIETQVQWKALLVENLRTYLWPFAANQKFLIQHQAPTPELQTLQKLVSSSENLWKSARAGYMPTVDLTAEFMQSPLSKLSNQQWSAGILITIPLWSQYETKASASSAFADYVAASGRFEEAERAESERRRTLMQKFEFARQNLVDATSNLEKSKRLYSDVLKSFQLGRLSVNDLLIEQNRRIESELTLSQSQWDFHKIVVEGCAASGLDVRHCF